MHFFLFLKTPHASKLETQTARARRGGSGRRMTQSLMEQSLRASSSDDSRCPALNPKCNMVLFIYQPAMLRPLNVVPLQTILQTTATPRFRSDNSTSTCSLRVTRHPFPSEPSLVCVRVRVRVSVPGCSKQIGLYWNRISTKSSQGSINPYVVSITPSTLLWPSVFFMLIDSDHNIFNGLYLEREWSWKPCLPENVRLSPSPS